MLLPLRSFLLLLGSAAISVPGSAVAGQSPIIVAPLAGASGLANPLALAHAGDGTGRLFIALQDGRIVIHSGTQVLPIAFLDIRPLVQDGGEQGLLGLAFHPDYPATPYFFVNYTCARSGAQPECEASGQTIIARFQVSADPDVADPASRRTLLVIPDALGVHNAGDLKFGPDGYLWIPMGDGGGDYFGQCRAQRDDSLRGKLLRIDVDQNVNAPPYYGIPPDNPYAGPGDPLDEIYARGLRNPYRFSFDRLTGDLFMGDVGENAREEVDFQAAGRGAGANYGWKIMEGTLCTGDTSNCPASVPPCHSPSFTPPILEADHAGGACAVIGGFRYRGSAIPAIDGWYLYSDYCGGRIYAATEGPPGTWTSSALDLDPLPSISSFGEDEAGELYFTTLGSTFGAVHRILPVPSTLSVDDVSAVEGLPGPPGSAIFTVSVSPPAGQPITVHYGTARGTATAGTDYTTVEGDLTFAPRVTSRTIVVPLLLDALDEDDETFVLDLSSPSGATLGDGQGVATILDDDPLPELTTTPCLVLEGDSGGSPCEMLVFLFPASGRTVTASFQTVDGTAVAGSDYVGLAGSLTFPPGETLRSVTSDVLGDLLPEGDEDFTLGLANLVNTTAAPAPSNAIDDDDDRKTELAHGVALTQALLGGASLHPILQSPLASYEVVVDAASGDAAPGLALERIAADGSTVLQGAVPIGTGTARSLRWQNSTSATIADQQVRVTAPCAPRCGADDRYRLRAYETTGFIPRFNNAGSQVTVVLLQNAGSEPVSGAMHFWSATGAFLATQPFALDARGSSAFLSFTAAPLQGQSGSVTVTHDAPHGRIVGKAVALEPATGYSFDALLTQRPR